MSAHADITIHSYRVVFDLERRIHRVDRWRLPLPYGLPLRSVGYAAAALALVLIIGRAPVLGAILASLPTPVRLVLVPAGIALCLTRLNPDGRPAHRAGASLARSLVGPRRRAAGRCAPRPTALAHFDALVVAPDARSTELRPGTVRGAACARFRYPVRLRQRGRRMTVRRTGYEPLPEGTRIAFDTRRRLVIR